MKAAHQNTLRLLVLTGLLIFTSVAQAGLMAKVIGSTGQNVKLTPHVLEFKTIEIDTDSAISGAGSDAFAFTAPRTGFYKIGASCLTYPSSSFGGIELYVFRNGSKLALLGGRLHPGVGFQNTKPNGYTIVRLNAGDKVDIRIAGINVNLNTQNVNSNFYVWLLDDTIFLDGFEPSAPLPGP